MRLLEQQFDNQLKIPTAHKHFYVSEHHFHTLCEWTSLWHLVHINIILLCEWTSLWTKSSSCALPTGVGVHVSPKTSVPGILNQFYWYSSMPQFETIYHHFSQSALPLLPLKFSVGSMLTNVPFLIMWLKNQVSLSYSSIWCHAVSHSGCPWNW